MVSVLFIETVPIRFQETPKSERLMRTSASSQDSPVGAPSALASASLAANRPASEPSGRSRSAAVNTRCRRAGVRHLIPYGYRHAFATAALSAGVPDAQVAALLGHSSTTMLHRYYSHLCGQVRVLKEALARVR